MKIEDLVALTKAGYTKADIEALGIALGQGSTNDVKPEESKEAKPAEESKTEEAKPAEAVKPENDRLKEMETKLDYAINRLNYMSVQGSSQPEQKKESIEDILQSVLK
jgi:small-conductance mechanosensitive channel